MSGPFSKASITSQPSWAGVVPADGNFLPLTAVGIGYDEVGYGEGGYGQGGYDAPSVHVQAAPEPIWTAETVR